MEEFTYAHADTSSGRRTGTDKLNKISLPAEIVKIRNNSFEREIPTADDETLSFLITLLTALKPKSILELGTAVGVSGAVMLDCLRDAKLVTVEKNENFYREAQENFDNLNLSDRAECVLSDAGEYLKNCERRFDFIFLDSAKVQYVKYVPDLKRVLNAGGVLVADDVLLYGWLTGENPVPEKRKMLFKHIEEYVNAVTRDEELYTTVLNVGGGIALSAKKRTAGL